MKSFSVATGRALKSIRHLVSQEIGAWESRGVRISVKESQAGEMLVLRCEVPKSGQIEPYEILQTIKASVANGLSHIIVDEYEKLLVVRLIDDNYAYLSTMDRDILKRKAMAKLAGKDGSTGLGHSSQRKSRVWAKLAEYLELEDEIVLEGFITFRLKEYLEELFDSVEETVEDYLTEREYKEFLRLLRHFMSRQKQSTYQVNIVRDGNRYQVLDEKMKPVAGEVGRFLDRPPRGIDLGVDDLIVSAVVTLAPEVVVWHGKAEDSPCYDLIHDLFEGRLNLCPGCPLDSG